MNRAGLTDGDLIHDIQPDPPPCFRSRAIWTEYLKSALRAAKQTNHSPVIWIGLEPAFNPSFNFCVDCEKNHQERMQALGRCRPEFLRNK